MAVTYYKSIDASAPTLSGSALSLTALLNSCLIAGYGSQSGLSWTRPNSTSNGASFKPASGSQPILQVYDNGQSANTYKEARVRAYETMSDLDTGTQPFPTVAQATTGLAIRKSTTADSSVRPWKLIADASRFYLFTQTGDFSTRYCVTFFGDIISYKTGGDSYSGTLIARSTEGTTESYDGFYQLNSSPSGSAIAGCYIDRSYTGLGGAVAIGKIADYSKAQQTVIGAGSTVLTYPNGPDGGLYLSRIWVTHGGALRGHLPGVWCPLHNLPLSDGDTFSGTGALSGRTFEAVSIAGTGQLMVETSNTWD